MTSNLILGLDIGGANTKAALIEYEKAKIIDSFSYIEYFPFWEQSKNQFYELFNRIISNLIQKNNLNANNIAYVAVTITAELSDAFKTKKEGILSILNEISKIFDTEKLRFITIENKYVNYKNAIENPIVLAGANWASTSLFLGRFIPNCILIDSGSTTTDIIPIYTSKPVNIGKTDTERIINHELIYTGGLRTTIPSITHYVPYKNQNVRISFEKFALISDVNRILNFISEMEYSNGTADNRSKSLENCYSRLARIICLDINSISKKELFSIAQYIHNKQIKIIEKEIKIFLTNLKLKIPQLFNPEPIFILTGLSSDFLIRKVLRKLNYNKIEYYDIITNIPENITSSAFAVAAEFLFNKLEVELK